MNDYRQISWQRNPWKRFLPIHAYRLHHESRAFLERELAANPAPTVVVTHHLPHPRSLPARFKGDLLNAAYASDLSDVIEAGAPALWVHGHTHDSCDYVATSRGSSQIRVDTATRTARSIPNSSSISGRGEGDGPREV